MRSALSAIAFTLTGFVVGAVVFIAASLVLAWTGPTSAPPNGNVDAPINVGATDQIKNAGLAINALAIFGDAILSGASRYLNFGTTAGAGGYGIRDNAGTMEFKNDEGDWSGFAPTTQTSGAVTNQTTLSCVGIYSCTTPSCPAGYIRSGCSVSTLSVDNNGVAGAAPTGEDQCVCSSPPIGPFPIMNCYVYCVR